MKKFISKALTYISKDSLMAVVALAAIVSSLITPAGVAFAQTSQPDSVIALQIEAKRNHTKSYGTLPVAESRAYVLREDRVTVTAYNSVPGQTDDSPCIGAQGTDICKIYAAGEHVCAANFVPLGTKLEVEGLGTCIVRDRMNARYTKRIDWYMGMDVAGARKFGVHTKQIAVFSK